MTDAVDPTTATQPSEPIHMGNPGARLAKRHETRLFRASQPLFWAFNMYARARRRDVVTVPFLGYAINGAVSIREMLLDDARFPNTNSNPETVLVTQLVGPNSLTNQNGEPHITLRRKLQDLFTPRFVDELCNRVLTGVLDDFEARLRAGEVVDVAKFTKVVTGSVVSHMNGEQFDPLDVEGLSARSVELSELGRAVATLVPPRLKIVPPETVEIAQAHVERLIAGVRETYDRGDENTIPGRFQARGVPWDVARGIMVVLILGGLETTQSGGARMVALLSDTDQWTRLRADHSLLGGAIDEALRVTTPVPIITRWVGEDTVFHGTRMRKDRLVVAFLNNASRDDRVIERGGDFDIGRAVPRELRQLHFGAGPHFCIGNNLARKEISLVIERILRLPREIEVLGREYDDDVLIPTYKSVLVRMRPA